MKRKKKINDSEVIMAREERGRGGNRKRSVEWWKQSGFVSESGRTGGSGRTSGRVSQ